MKTGTAETGRSQNEFPAFFHDWEHYPSGRRFERVQMIREIGAVCSISKIIDSDGTVEYRINVKEAHSSSPYTSPSEFTGPSFGSVRCNQELYSRLHAELVHCASASSPAVASAT